jgi:hypothetical protein
MPLRQSKALTSIQSFLFSYPQIELGFRFLVNIFQNTQAFGSCMESHERTIWIADAHRDDENRFVVQADEKLTAFLELEGQIGNS